MHPRTQNFVCSFFVLLFAVTQFSFAADNNHFQFPHFFSQSPDAADKYVLRFNKGLMQFSDAQISFQIVQPKTSAHHSDDPEEMMKTGDAVTENVELNFVNANTCAPFGSEPLASRSNYFLGNNSNNWKSDLQNYNSLLYKNLYNNIDLKYYVLNDEVKYDYTVQRGGEVADIKMNYSGIKSLSVDENGALCIRTHLTELKDYLPKSYQVINGKEIPVKVRYRLFGKRTVGFVADAYNKNYPLVIDPALIYSTFVGGNADDYEYTGGISLDATGNIYVTGRTFSANFPTTAGAVQTGYGGGMDAFVFKLNPSGTALIFSTFVGGNDVDAGYTTKIDPVTNDVYVAGTTGSANFPTTAGAFHTAYAGGLYDPFLFKLNASGNAFIYSTLMGNAQDDYGASLAIDNLGNAYVVGQSSGIYPTTAGAYQSAFAGGPWDVFVTKFNPTGSAVIFSTMLGGASEDHSHSIQVDANYDVYVEGMAKAGFPTTAGAYDVSFNGGQWDMYVTKMNSTGTALIYSTYVGGPGADWTWNGLVIDNAGNAYCTGYVEAGFPTTAGAYQTTYGGGAFDVAVFKLNPTGNALLYSTYIGGTGDDEGWGISLGANNEAFITGLCSFSYPYTPCAWDTTFNGVQDAFISELNPAASSLLYSSYIGGSAYDQGYNIIDVGNFVYVAGATSSVDFPHTVGAYDTTSNGLKDIMVFEMDISGVNTVTASFNSVTSVCQNGSVQFNNTSVNATAYSWDFDDGGTSTLQNPSHTFADTGVHNVRLIVSASCAVNDTFIVPVTILAPPVAAFTSVSNCNLSVDFTNTGSGGTSYAWNFGDAGTSALPSPSHIYSTDGSYLVTLIVSNAAGCSDTVQQQVTVNPVAVAAFNFSPPQCTLFVTMQNTSANATSYAWNFGDGVTSTSANPTHTYSDSGTYIIMLIANPGVCADTAFQSVTLHVPPVASFADAPACNLSCDFVNSTIGAVSYAWNFGDAATSSAASPSHTYNLDGNYTVTLIATDAAGCTDTATNQVNIAPVPVAAFTFAAAQCSLTSAFQNTSLNSTAVLWNFGDGNTITTDNPSHTYADTGTYSVMLIANPGACADTMIQTVSVHTAPVAGFTDVPQCNLACTFINNSNGGTSYAWDFGDAQTSSLVSPSHIYSLDGNYTVTLITQNNFGCSDTVTQQVQINPVPIAAFTFTPPQCTMLVPCQNASQNSSSYLWDYGDGQTSTVTNPSHLFSASGTFLITLISNSGGCADTATQSVTINPLPVSSFTGVGACDFTFSFLNNSAGGISYSWDFGDAQTSSQTSPSHTFPSSGNYFVSLITTDQFGCNDTSQQNITVNDNPVAAFSALPAPCTLLVPFQNSSANASSYQWNFGDGSSSTDSDPQHEYTFSGTYTITLIASATGCADTMTQQVTVQRPPVADFSQDNYCTLNAIFQNLSDSATTFAWDLGDGTTDVSPFPVHQYAAPGSYQVSLISTNAAGCADTASKTINVVVFAPASFVSSYDTCLMQGQFSGTSVNASSSYWIFGDGSTSASQSTIHQYAHGGVYPVVYITNNNTPCADTLPMAFHVAEDPEHGLYIPNCFTPNGDGINEQFSVIDFSKCNEYHLMIFDRWGEMIFETDDLSQPWDGKYKGKPVPEDVYAYLLKGNGSVKQGSVMVMK